MRIVSNAVVGAANAVRNSSYYSDGSFPSDQNSKLTVYGYAVGPMVRIQPGQSELTGYAVYASEAMDSLKLDRFNADGSYTHLAEVANTVSSGDILDIIASGSTISVEKNGSPVGGLSVTDTTFSGGYAGIVSWYDSQSGDSWESGAGGAGSLVDGQCYDYYIRCSDGIGNANTDDLNIHFCILTEGGPTTHTLGSFELQGVIQ
jgi:hypothetical protein